MEKKYLEHIVSLEELKANHYRVLLLLNTDKFTQAEISRKLNIKKQNVNRIFKTLIEYGLIEEVETIGRNKYFKAIDPKKINLNIPGQLKFV
ncbi:MarR family transcriptional regulator [Clostridium sp. B9]|uniref:MarR family transcriptional regulator n=1 Tax=Clostridium sp. B9 TaxID=3423224 RepID=UPI003D2ED574